MEWIREARRGREFWRKMPLRAFAIFTAAVFCLFACFGLIGAVGTAQPWYAVLYAGLYSGIVGAGFGVFGARGHYKLMIVFGLLVFVAWPLVFNWLQPGWQALPKARLDFAGIVAVAAVITGYILFLWFIGTEGRRHNRLETEVALAGQIHRGLAPAVDRRVGGFEFAGASEPSGQVGGDLLDLIATPDGDAAPGWLAYVADVSGHGVAAGVLMGVVKSAAHAWLLASEGARRTQAASAGGGAGAAGGERYDLLPGLNRVLCDLLPQESYVTLGALAATEGGQLRYAAAGHPALLHYHQRSGELTPHGCENFPLGMFATASFNSVEVTAEPGDVLAIYTDGMYEIFNHAGGEFGLEGLTAALRQAAAKPLAEAVQAVISAARAFGHQTDDQTLLLVRISHSQVTKLASRRGAP